MCELLCGVASVFLVLCVFVCACLQVSVWLVCVVLSGAVWCVCVFNGVVFVCDLFTRVCVFCLWSIVGVVWFVVCVVLCLCALC